MCAAVRLSVVPAVCVPREVDTEDGHRHRQLRHGVVQLERRGPRGRRAVWRGFIGSREGRGEDTHRLRLTGGKYQRERNEQQRTSLEAWLDLPGSEGTTRLPGGVKDRDSTSSVVKGSRIHQRIERFNLSVYGSWRSSGAASSITLEADDRRASRGCTDYKYACEAPSGVPRGRCLATCPGTAVLDRSEYSGSPWSAPSDVRGHVVAAFDEVDEERIAVRDQA